MNRKHLFFYWLLQPLVVLFLKLKFGYTFEKPKNLPKNYIVLSNHLTDFDPLFVGASFRRQMYFVGSEHISRWKFAYKLLKFAFAPIMRPKGTVASATVLEIMRHVRAGASVCMFAEGVRSWDGRTCPILPSTAKLIKKAGCGLVTYKIVGGYFVSPWWSTSPTRRGHIHGAPVRILTAEEIAELSTDEIYRIILEDLHEDAYARQLADPKPYRGKGLAEGMEQLLFRCPACGGRDCFTSRDSTVTCSQCGMSFSYDQYGMLSGLPFQTVQELSDWQMELVAEDVANGVAYTSPHATLIKVSKHTETPIDAGPLSLSTETLRCGETEFPTDRISDLATHGKRAIVFSCGRDYYELTPAEGSNALKYLLYFNTYKNNVPESVR